MVLALIIIGILCFMFSFLILSYNIRNVLLAALMPMFILLGVICLAFGIGVKIVYNDFVLGEHVYLKPVEGEMYVMETQNIYIFREDVPVNDSEIRTVTSNDTVNVKIETVEEGEIPCMLHYEKYGWIKYEEEYVFYIPE